MTDSWLWPCWRVCFCVVCRRQRFAVCVACGVESTLQNSFKYRHALCTQSSIVSPVRSQRDALNTRVSATQFEFLVTWLKRGFYFQLCRIFYFSFSEDQISTYYQSEFNCFWLFLFLSINHWNHTATFLFHLSQSHIGNVRHWKCVDQKAWCGSKISAA